MNVMVKVRLRQSRLNTDGVIIIFFKPAVSHFVSTSVFPPGVAANSKAAVSVEP